MVIPQRQHHQPTVRMPLLRNPSRIPKTPTNTVIRTSSSSLPLPKILLPSPHPGDDEISLTFTHKNRRRPTETIKVPVKQVSSEEGTALRTVAVPPPLSPPVVEGEAVGLGEEVVLK